MKSDNHYYLVLEFCNGGNLSAYLELIKRIPENVSRVMIK